MSKVVFGLVFVFFFLGSCGGQKEAESPVEEKNMNVLEKKIKLQEQELTDTDKFSKLRLVKTYLRYGDAYYKEDIYADKALEILNKMDKNSKVLYFKGYAFEIKKEYKKALGYYNEVLKIGGLDQRERINTLNQKGHIYDLEGKTRDANRMYVLAEKLDEKHIKTLLNRGRYEARKGDVQKAERYFNRILSLGNDTFLSAEVLYNLSTIYQNREGGLDQAIEYATLGIKNHPDYPNNYLSLGVSYILKGGESIKKAPEQLNKALRIYPKMSTAHKYLGIYYYLEDNFDKSIIHFKKQIESIDTDILLMKDDKDKSKLAGQYDLSKTYALLGDVTNSLKYLKLVLNGKNTDYYYGFLKDLSREESPFQKLKKDIMFNTDVRNILLIYTKK